MIVQVPEPFQSSAGYLRRNYNTNITEELLAQVVIFQIFHLSYFYNSSLIPSHADHVPYKDQLTYQHIHVYCKTKLSHWHV